MFISNESFAIYLPVHIFKVCPPPLFDSSPAYWNATRAFMILSAMSCFAGIIAGILSFAHFSAFERFNRSFAAGIMFFVSSEFSINMTY